MDPGRWGDRPVEGLCHAKIGPLPKLAVQPPPNLVRMRQKCSESELEAQSKSTCCAEARSIKMEDIAAAEGLESEPQSMSVVITRHR